MPSSQRSIIRVLTDSSGSSLQGRQQVRPEDGPVAGQGGWLPAPVVFEEPEPLGRRIRECDVGADLPGEGSATRLVEHVTQPGLGAPFGHVPGRHRHLCSYILRRSRDKMTTQFRRLTQEVFTFVRLLGLWRVVVALITG